jgi:hypothetical protein
MGIQQEQIEWIVREVVRRLEAASTPGSTSDSKPAASENNSSELRLSVPVISVARLEGKLSGVKQVVVSKTAVVTPAAKDLLRDQKIALVRGEVTKPGNTWKLSLVAGLAETTFEPASLWREIKAENIQIEELARTGVASVTTELCEQVTRGGRLGILLTTNVAAAVCLANRTSGVRAAEARCATSTRDAVRGVGVNLLVVNPVGKSTFELKRMIGVLLAGGGDCPAEWQGKLD